MNETTEGERTLRVLVVDDDMLARMTAAQCVKQQGHEAALAEGGAQAMEMLRSDCYDLVLLDLLMPEMDGLEVLTGIKADPQLRAIPVIMVSGADESESLAKCLKAGAVGNLSKPLDPRLLAEQIAGCLS